MADISADINTSMYPQAGTNALLGSATQGAQLRGQQAQNALMYTDAQRQHLGLIGDQLGQLYGVISSLAAKGPNISYQDIQNAGNYALQNGIAMPGQVQSLLSGISPQSTPQQLQQVVQNAAALSLDAHDRVETYIGAPMAVNIGGQTVTGRANVNGFFPTGFLNNTLTPDQKAAPTAAGVTRAGTPYNKPMVGVLADEGYDQAGNPTSGGATGAPSGPAARLHTLGGSNGTPAPASSVAGSPASGAQDANAPVPNPPGGVYTQAPVGVAGPATASTNQYIEDQKNAANFQSRVFPLVQSFQALSRLGENGTGPMSDQLNTLKSAMVELGLPAGDIQGITDFATAKKYLQQNVLAGNPGSDQMLAAMRAGNPTTDLAQPAAKDLVASAIGQQRIAQARYLEAKKLGLDPTQYNGWLADTWQKGLDQRAFVWDFMDPQAKAALVNGMNDKQFAKFQSTVGELQGLGVIQPQGGAGGQ
jgi:hypothetical protein